LIPIPSLSPLWGEERLGSKPSNFGKSAVKTRSLYCEPPAVGVCGQFPKRVTKG
jgi:hypothetical protein